MNGSHYSAEILAQSPWTQLTPPANPPGLFGHSLVHYNRSLYLWVKILGGNEGIDQFSQGGKLSDSQCNQEMYEYSIGKTGAILLCQMIQIIISRWWYLAQWRQSHHCSRWQTQPQNATCDCCHQLGSQSCDDNPWRGPLVQESYFMFWWLLAVMPACLRTLCTNSTCRIISGLNWLLSAMLNIIARQLTQLTLECTFLVMDS